MISPIASHVLFVLTARSAWAPRNHQPARRGRIHTGQNEAVADDFPELDLDDGAVAEANTPFLRRQIAVPLWTAPIAAVALAVLFTTATHVWDAAQNRRARQSVASLIVTIPPDADFDGGRTGDTFGYNSAIQVINAGPLPLRLGQITSTSVGITLDGDARNTVIAAGGIQNVLVHLGIDCSTWSRTSPIDVRATVRTADHRHRSVARSLTIRRTIWENLPTC